MPGSLRIRCDSDGKCACNTGYHGDKCSECTNGFYKTQSGSSVPSVMIDLMFEFIASSCRFLHGNESQNFSFSLLSSFCHDTENYSAPNFENPGKWLLLEFLYLFHVIDIYFSK